MGVFFDKKRKGWRFQFKIKGVRYTSHYFDSKREALDSEVKARNELINPPTEEKTPTDMDFLNLVNERLDHLKAYNQPSHYKDVTYHARRWIDEWGRLMSGQITPDSVQAYVLRRKDETSPYTANKDLRLLRSVFNFGIKRKWIRENPANEVDFLPVKKKKRQPPAKENMLRVILCADPDTRDYLWTISLTLARKGEIDRLQWQDVDFQSRCVWLRTRKKKHGDEEARPIPMLDRLHDLLWRRHQRRDPDKPWVFWHRYWSRKEKKWVEGPYADRKGIMKTLCSKADVPYFRFHALRHLGASMMADEGKPISAIQRILGHENLKTTERYLHALGEAEREAIQSLSKLDDSQGEGDRQLQEDGGGLVRMPERYWKRKVERPSYETLQQEVRDLGYRGTGKKYGVSDTTVRRWLSYYKTHGNESVLEGVKSPSQKKVLAEVLAIKQKDSTETG